MPDALAAPAAPAIATTPGSPATPQPVTSAGVDPGAWRSGLAPEYQTAKSFDKFTDVNALAKSYLEMEKMNSAPKLPVPQDSWGDQEWSDFYGKVGRPQNPEGYEFQPLQGLPEGMTASPETDKWFAENAHKLGLTKAQAKGLRDNFVNYQADQAKGGAEKAQAAAAAREDGIKKLQASYGPKWDAAIDGAQKVVSQYGSQDFKDLMKSSGLDSHPAVLDFMAKLGGVLHDHSVITGIPRGGSFGTSPSGAASEIQRMNTDPAIKAILTDSRHAQHDSMLAKREELYKIAYPS